jgi:hypothetical protein
VADSVYSTDRYEGPPPLAESTNLLKYQRAGQTARKVLRLLWGEGPGQAPFVYFPLGLPHRQVSNYKLIKASAFLFRTPRQRAAWEKALERFAEETGCGPEALALRRGCRGRRRGSLADLATDLYQRIRNGEDDPTQALNLTRSCRALDQLKDQRPDDIRRRKAEALHELAASLDAARLDESATLTGLYVCADDFGRL